VTHFSAHFVSSNLQNEISGKFLGPAKSSLARDFMEQVQHLARCLRLRGKITFNTGSYDNYKSHCNALDDFQGRCHLRHHFWCNDAHYLRNFYLPASPAGS
jgi:hypothetical protein